MRISRSQNMPTAAVWNLCMQSRRTKGKDCLSRRQRQLQLYPSQCCKVGTQVHAAHDHATPLQVTPHCRLSHNGAKGRSSRILLSRTLPISCRGISGTGTVWWRSNCSSFAFAVESPSSSASRITCHILPLARDICFVPACICTHAVTTLF